MSESPVANHIAALRARLDAVFVIPRSVPRFSPISQLIKSLVSSRTRDAVSLAAFKHLARTFGSPGAIAAATPAAVEHAIAAVTFPDVKAARLIATLRLIGAERPDFDLALLGELPLPAALAWLERFPGVGRKVAAATLAFSTLARPVFVVDTHVLRVAARAGIAANMTPATASERVTAAMPGWRTDDFIVFHAQLKRLGQDVCRWDTPQCTACPVSDLCATATATVTVRQPALL